MKSTLIGVGVMLAATIGASLTAGCARMQPGPAPAPAFSHDVTQFGANGDGTTDDTTAFTAAFKAAAEAGGIVRVPAGNYLIKTHLTIPEFVTLEGVWTAPPVGPEKRGSTLLAVEGKGDKDGTPFITMCRGSTLKGISIFYPEQIDENPPIPYPWTVRAAAEGSDNCSIVNVLMVNPYQAVDFGTNPAGRHYIKGLYAQALYRGLFIDNCFDVGRVEDVHFWPFWRISDKLRAFSEAEAEAFVIGRTDWEFMTNCFCIFYKVGFHFIKGKHGPGNVLLTQCGSDVGPCAVKIDEIMKHAGVSFVNGQFMAGIEVDEKNEGPLKFTGCGFWPIKQTASHAVLKGKGQVTFDNCHFSEWDKRKEGVPCINADCEGITITGCDFMQAGKNQISLGSNVKSAIIVANRLRGGNRITNQSKGSVQIGLNSEQ